MRLPCRYFVILRRMDMREELKKLYLRNSIITALVFAVLFSVYILVLTIPYGKWLIGISGAVVVFAVATVLTMFFFKLRFNKFEKYVHSQEERYSAEFSDEETELLSSNGNVYLSANWIINLPYWAFFKEHITEFSYEKFNYSKGDSYCCFIHTADDINYTIRVQSLKAAEKIEKWVTEK